MKKYLIILFSCFSIFSYSQKVEFGITYSPIQFSKITFDNDYIIFQDYSSLSTSNTKSHAYLTLLSTGVFCRYKWRSTFIQSEFNFFENKFGKQIPDWVTASNRYFTYSTIEIPILYGYTPNPGNLIKLRFYGGLNNKLGKFKNVFFSDFNSMQDDYSISGSTFYDKLRKDELRKKFRFYYLDIIAGMGISSYGKSLDFRIEKNITNLNKDLSEYNANYKNLLLFRISLSFTLNSIK